MRISEHELQHDKIGLTAEIDKIRKIAHYKGDGGNGTGTAQVIDDGTPSTVLYIDTNYSGASTPDGTIHRPFNTFLEATAHITAQGFTSVKLDIAPGVYVENVTFPATTITIHGNNSYIVGNIEFLGNQLAVYDLIIVGDVNLSSGRPSTEGGSNFYDCLITGNLTVTMYVIMINCIVGTMDPEYGPSPYTINVSGANANLVMVVCGLFSPVICTGEFSLGNSEMYVVSETPAISSTDGRVIVFTTEIFNYGTGGGIYCDNGAVAGLDNIIQNNLIYPTEAELPDIAYAVNCGTASTLFSKNNLGGALIEGTNIHGFDSDYLKDTRLQGELIVDGNITSDSYQNPNSTTIETTDPNSTITIKTSLAGVGAINLSSPEINLTGLDAGGVGSINLSSTEINLTAVNSEDILPKADSTYNIGSAAVRYTNGYFDSIDATTLTGSGTGITGVGLLASENTFTQTNTFPSLKINSTGTTAVTTIGNTTINLASLRLDQAQTHSAGTMQPALNVYGNYTIDSATVVYPSAMKFYPTATVSASVSNNGYLIAFLMQPQLTLGSGSTYRMTAVDISPVIDVQTGTGTTAFVSCFSARGVTTSGEGTKTVNAYYSYQAFNSAAGTITGQNSYAYWVKPNADAISYSKYGFYCGDMSGAGFANYGAYIGTISGNQSTTYTGAVTGNFGMYIKAVSGTHAAAEVLGNFGIYIGDVTDTRPYAIYTNAGPVRLGDTLTVVGAFGVNGATAQTAYASGGAVTTSAGAFGFGSDAERASLTTLVANIRTALVNNGIMS